MLAEGAVGQAADDQEADQRREAAEQDRELEADDRVRRNRGEGLAADHQRPVVGSPDRQGVAAGDSGQAANQGEVAHLARLGVERVVELGERRGGVDLELVEAARLQALRGFRHVAGGVVDANQFRHLSALRAWRAPAREWRAPSPRRWR